MNFKMGWSVKLVAIGFLVAGTHSFAHAGGDGSLDCSTDSSASYCNQNAVSTGGADSLADLAGPQTVTTPTTPENNPTTTDPVFTVDVVASPSPDLPGDLDSANPVLQAGGVPANISGTLNQITGTAVTIVNALKNSGAYASSWHATRQALQRLGYSVDETYQAGVLHKLYNTVMSITGVPVNIITVDPTLGCSAMGQSVFGTPCSATQTQN